MKRLKEALTGVTRLGFDTAPVIYFVEANAKYDPVITAIFQRIANGELAGVTSVITLTELTL